MTLNKIESLKRLSELLKQQSDIERLKSVLKKRIEYSL